LFVLLISEVSATDVLGSPVFAPKSARLPKMPPTAAALNDVFRATVLLTNDVL
jgi:hypothetical protein